MTTSRTAVIIVRYPVWVHEIDMGGGTWLEGANIPGGTIQIHGGGFDTGWWGRDWHNELIGRLNKVLLTSGQLPSPVRLNDPSLGRHASIVIVYQQEEQFTCWLEDELTISVAQATEAAQQLVEALRELPPLELVKTLLASSPIPSDSNVEVDACHEALVAAKGWLARHLALPKD